MLGDTLDQPMDPAAVVDPSAGRVVEVRGDVDADPLVAGAGMEVESRVLLAPLAAAIGLAAGALLEHERTADQGLIGQESDGARAGVALLDRAMGTRRHEPS
jgi:hypothetical protein